MKLKKIITFSILALGIFIVFYFTKGTSFPSAFEVLDITNKIQFTEKQDFSGATLVNLDEDSEQEIFISSHGSSNLFLKRSGDKFIPVNIAELADAAGLTFSVTACDLDMDGRDEILILNRPDNNKSASHSRIVKYINGKWVDIIPKDDPFIKLIGNGYSSTCIDRKGDGKYGMAISNENGKIIYLEIVDSKIINIVDSIGLGLSSKGRSISGIPGPTGQWLASEKWQYLYAFDVGEQSQQTNDGVDPWYATTLTIRRILNPEQSLALRGEYFNDRHQTTVVTATANGFQVVGTSLNFDQKLEDTALWRTELRGFYSKDKIYPEGASGKNRLDGFLVTSLSMWF